jgi:hypothetical protein
MADKDPTRGMQPMDDYLRSITEKSKSQKALDIGTGIALGAVGAIPIGVAKKMSEAKDKEKKQKLEKSGIELDAENAKKDRRVKEEQEAYEKYDKNRLKDQGSFKKGGKVSSASARADGCAQRGKTRGKMV